MGAGEGQMLEQQFALANAVGLHARAATLLVQTAARFKATVYVRHRARTADARSLLSLLSLGAGRGSTITVHAEGEDAAQALAAIADLIAGNFGEGL